MKNLIISASLSILSLWGQGVTTIATNCSFETATDFSFSYGAFSPDKPLEKETFQLVNNIDSNNGTNSTICHYSASTNTISYETISVSSAISLVELTSSFGTGYLPIPKKDVKSALSVYDNRVEIDYSPTNNGYPFSAIGIITGKTNNGRAYGSIFMAPGGFGITAAHCVINQSTSTFISNPEAGFKLSKIVSKDHIEFDYGSYISDIYVPKEYVDSPYGALCDWAVVKFSDSSLEKNVGSLNIGSGFSMYDKVNTAVGFPADKTYGPHSSSGKGTVETSDEYYDLYQFVSKGMSGGPVMFDYFNSNTLEEYTVVSGIVSQQIVEQNCVYSRATRISNTLISLLRLLK